MKELTRHDMARYIDQALLKAGVTRDEIRAACEEATLRRFRALCVLPRTGRVPRLPEH